MKDIIYLADDEENIRNIVKMFLESEGYVVEVFDNGDKLYSKFLNKPSNLVILDIMMPGTDGLTLCNKIRNISDVPIILLTAKDSDSDYIAGITLGSDDYLTKPFRPTILNMRVKALLRRIKMTKKSVTKENYICGNLYLLEQQHMICCNEEEIKFTLTEFDCLSYLMKHFNMAISRQQLLNDVWGYDNMVETRVTDETIRRIRKKLSKINCNVVITNKWGYGYILQEVKDEKDI